MQNLSDRGDAVASVAEMPVLGAGALQAANDLVAQVAEVHDGVDDQLGRQAQQVDFTAVDKAILAVQKRYDDFDQINRYADGIMKTSDDIKERVRIMRKAIEREVVEISRQIEDFKQFVQSVGGAE